ncbi:hypothetical protein [Neptuniibacter pectenicola]|uniref:hypothetical protein n=1 Tax=Neptuniibacter pectenicola TaxID=1806669 RepID=UPI00079AE64C|nr:hypothetical protein [Neptuniibacter pectenicola]KXJ51885.1 MAG: hypothetical protein AXW15_11360 [Neptuniibacter sp. Phe_28]
MKARIAIVLIMLALGGVVIWQAQTAGKLKSQLEGYVSTIESMVEYENNQIAQRAADDELLAETNNKHKLIIRENYELRKQLQQVSGCSSDYIDADTVEWVRQYRSSN